MASVSGRALALVPLVVALTACGSGGAGVGDEGRPLVVASVYPLAFAAEEVGADRVEVQSLTAPGVEPHDLELSSDQVRLLSEADLVLYLGGGFQPALEDVVSGLDDERALDVLAEAGPDGEGGEPGDPHVWLDPIAMAGIADVVAGRLAGIDPGSAETFTQNAARARDRLEELDRGYREGLRDCETRALVTSHAAFGYLAARYDLEQVGISGLDPEGEPSPGRLAEVARFVEDNDVRTIFFEELVSPDIAETIASETGARTQQLSPLESEPTTGDYLDAMEQNLAALRTGLRCE